MQIMLFWIEAENDNAQTIDTNDTSHQQRRHCTCFVRLQTWGSIHPNDLDVQTWALLEVVDRLLTDLHHVALHVTLPVRTGRVSTGVCVRVHAGRKMMWRY